MTSSVVDVAGVVDGVEAATWDEFIVEAEARWVRPLALCLSVPLVDLSSVLGMRLFLLLRLRRNEGIVSTRAQWCSRQAVEA